MEGFLGSTKSITSPGTGGVGNGAENRGAGDTEGATVEGVVEEGGDKVVLVPAVPEPEL